MNCVQLVGRMATDVDVREVTGGSKVCSFIVAVDRSAEEADFFRIKAWNAQAEAAAEHLGKGTSRSGRGVAASGYLRERRGGTESGLHRGQAARVPLECTAVTSFGPSPLDPWSASDTWSPVKRGPRRRAGREGRLWYVGRASKAPHCLWQVGSPPSWLCLGRATF